MAVFIREFAQKYVDSGFPHNPTLMNRVFLSDVSTSTLVWKEDNYLVEFYLMHPFCTVTTHFHPFENVSIHYSGKILGFRNGKPGTWLTQKDSGHISQVLPAGIEHSFMVGSEGATFYNISSFTSDKDITSALLRYSGLPLGPIHKKLLESKE